MNDIHQGVENNFFDHFGPEAREFLERKGFGRTVEPGERPAVIVIDLQKVFTDPTSDVGSDLDLVVTNTCRILDEARLKSIPIFFFRIAFN